MVKLKPKLKVTKLHCRYCKHFQEASTRQVETLGRATAYYRKCKVKKNYVHEKEEACDNFILSNIIFCDRDDNWLHISVCLHRVKKRRCTKKCKLYKIIVEVSKDV